MKKILAIALLPLLMAGCGTHPTMPGTTRTAAPLAVKNNPKVEILVTIEGTITGRIEKSNGDVGALVVDTKDGEQTVYLTETTALSWDPRIKAIRGPNAQLDLKAGTRVDVLAVEVKNQGWGPATWLRAKSVVLLVG